MRDLVDIHQQSHTTVHVLTVHVSMEGAVYTPTSQRRQIDILISLQNENIGTHQVAIENKIVDSSVEEIQLLDEYEGLKGISDEDAQVSFIYLTPSMSPASQRAFSLLPEAIIKKHLTWSVYIDILQLCLEDDAKGNIDPLSYETRFVIKSFIRFVVNGFTTSLMTRRARDDRYIKNYEGIVNGLDEVLSLLQEKGDIFIGYTGGKTRLEQASLEQLSNNQ